MFKSKADHTPAVIDINSINGVEEVDDFAGEKYSGGNSVSLSSSSTSTSSSSGGVTSFSRSLTSSRTVGGVTTTESFFSSAPFGF